MAIRSAERINALPTFPFVGADGPVVSQFLSTVSSRGSPRDLRTEYLHGSYGNAKILRLRLRLRSGCRRFLKSHRAAGAIFCRGTISRGSVRGVKTFVFDSDYKNGFLHKMPCPILLFLPKKRKCQILPLNTIAIFFYSGTIIMSMYTGLVSL